MIKLALQSGGIRDSFTDSCIEACDRLGVSHDTFGIIPFSHKLCGIEEFDSNSVYIPFGCTKLVELGIEGKLPSNWKLFYDKHNFEFSTLLESSVSSNLLNNDASTHYLHDVIHRRFTHDIFIKPSNDLKFFAGVVVESGSCLSDVLSQVQCDSLLYDNKSSTVIISKRKHTGTEFRVFVVDGRVVASSYYKVDGKHVQDRIVSLPCNVKELALKFRPASAYVVDFSIPICNDFSSLKIVEYNAIQCSGHYLANTESIIKALYVLGVKLWQNS